jgi:hypothetical protein
MGKGEARGDGEREVDYTIESRLEEAVMAADSSSNAAKLLEVVLDGFHREAVRDCTADAVTVTKVTELSGAQQYTNAFIAGRPGNTSGKGGCCSARRDQRA